MFNLTIVDHVRLSFGHVVQNYTIHAQAADRLARFAFYARIAVVALTGIGTALSVALLLGAGRAVQIGTAVVVGIAFATSAVLASLGVEERLTGHRYRANRLWLLCERYRALLAEIHDGLVDRDVVLARRDALIQQFNDIHEQGAPAATTGGASSTRTQSAGKALTDEQIDQFLPAVLRKSSGSNPPAAVPH
jgi:hypothetical protein